MKILTVYSERYTKERELYVEMLYRVKLTDDILIDISGVND